MSENPRAKFCSDICRVRAQRDKPPEYFNEEGDVEDDAPIFRDYELETHKLYRSSTDPKKFALTFNLKPTICIHPRVFTNGKCCGCGKTRYFPWEIFNEEDTNTVSV